MMFPKFDKAGRGDTMGGEAIGLPGVPGRKQPVLSDANICLSCLMQIYGFYRDLQTTLFHSVAEARFPGGEDDLARGGVTGVPAGDLIIRGVWKCSGMKKSRSLGNGKILIPNLSSACRRRFVRGWFGRFRRKAYLCLPIRFYYTIG